MNMVDLNPATSIIILNANGLNNPSERQRLSDGIKKEKPVYIYCLQETHCKSKGTNRTKVKGWRRIYHINTHQNLEWLY